MVGFTSGCSSDSGSDQASGDVVIHFESDALAMESLIAFYPFWESADDHSGHENHGINHGAQYVRDRFGSIESAIELDGESAHVVLAQQVVGTDLGASTVSLWFKTTQTHAGGLFFEGIKGGKGLWLKLQPGKNRILARAKGAFDVETPGAYNDGRWHHLVLRTEASAFATLFMDGDQVSSVPFNEDFEGPEFLPVTPVIGRMGEPGAEEPGDYFQGTLDDITVFRGALSDDQVGALFRDGPNRVPTAVVDGDRTLFVPEVGFDASNSWDDDGAVIEWEWDFGDGTETEQGAVVTHAFPEFGTYTITVTVIDDEGGRNSATTSVVLRDPACPQIECSEEDLWAASWIQLELAVLVESNKYRASGATCGGVPMDPVPPLEMNEICRAASRLHALDMGQLAYFSHDGLDGSSPGDRMERAGFTGPGPWGENIAAGQQTAEEVVKAWIESPGHCSNIMDPDYRVLGAGYALVPGSPSSHYWVQTFAGGH
jgi:uncharacterized protein YkwD